MTQRTRNIIANSFVGVSFLFVVMFVAQHFMAAPSPTWHRDLAWLALAFVIASDLVRGWRRRRSLQDPE
jgi:hypothetical protein